MSSDYDIYYDSATKNEVQLKCGSPREMKTYEAGDLTELADGVYVGYGGVAIVYLGLLVTVLENVYDKYGNLLDKSAIVNSGNPVVNAMSLLKMTDLEQVSDEEIERMYNEYVRRHSRRTKETTQLVKG